MSVKAFESNNHARQHSTVVVHPTCNRKVVGSNPTAGFNFWRFPHDLSALTIAVENRKISYPECELFSVDIA